MNSPGTLWQNKQIKGINKHSGFLKKKPQQTQTKKPLQLFSSSTDYTLYKNV